MSATIGFYGGVGSVTGANFVLDVGTARIAIDCGLEQGNEFAGAKNAEAFQYDPSGIDVLIVTHAHADHIGRVPKLVRDGFKGKIYSTPPTKDLAAIMLHDALGIMQYEAAQGGPAPLYEEADIGRALALWTTVQYHHPLEVGDVSVTLYDAGHILGSSHAVFERNGKRVMFTGDIGNVPQPLMAAPEAQSDIDYMVMESVYGNRLHERVEDRTSMLLEEIKHTIAKRGTLIIPAFSLERTQAMLFEINNFVESGEIDALPVFLDSPLAIMVTDVYRAHRAYLKPEIRAQIEAGDDVFDFPKLKLTRTARESDGISEVHGPKVIIAGSGMSHGGRVLAHELEYLGRPDTTLLLVGYQTVGSVGRLLQDGVKRVTIDGVPVKVRARISTISGYSGHADRDMLIDFVAQSADHLKKVFVTMGEERASLFLVQRLRDYMGLNAVAPEADAVESIDF
jgi:metallo-beta-lactamase family protein